ncbi:MAG: alkaline phosphatase family protein [Nitrococcus sp.]|nr:alkaline phosphatase family protein [Nitrococcus sp.]
MSDLSAVEAARRLRDAATDGGVGPILFARGLHADRLLLTALLVRPVDTPAPNLTTPEGAFSPETVELRGGFRVWRYTFSVPTLSDAHYRIEGERYAVNAALGSDLRLAYVSCNGREYGDRDRAVTERNALWRRLARQHAERPFQLLLQGGDQLYADEMFDLHPALRAWSNQDWRVADGDKFSDLAEGIRNYLFARYLELYGQPATAWLMARVPSLAMWDDHDICDGWGSMPYAQLDSPIGRGVFQIARELFLLFQLGAARNELPAICPDRSGSTLTWALQLPGLRLIAPDLRSERRPNRVLGEHGWAVLRSELDAVTNEHVFLLSSVPVLGPRLSWVEAALHLIPHMQKYEDDLRDQWQSRAHRSEWRAFLEALLAVHERGDGRVTVLSGEIHLATHGTMQTRVGPLHQLVASGVTHPAPPAAYARALGMLARFAESPLPNHPIRLHPLPGQRAIYTAQRNYLILERRAERWRACWELEHGGTTPCLDLGG